MNRSPTAVTVVGICLLLVGGVVAWQVFHDDWSEHPFDRCRIDQGTISLDYSFGRSEDVRTSFEVHGRDVVVELRIRLDDVPRHMDASGGTFEFRPLAGFDRVRYADGEQLACQRSR